MPQVVKRTPQTAVDILRQEIANLEADDEREQEAIDAANAVISDAEAEVVAINQRRSILQATIGNLNSVIRRLARATPPAVESSDDDTDEEDSSPPESETPLFDPFELEHNTRRSPTEAVVNLLRQHSEGLSMRAVADALENAILTTSTKPRRIVQTTLFQLKDKGILEPFKSARGEDCVRLKSVS